MRTSIILLSTAVVLAALLRWGPVGITTYRLSHVQAAKRNSLDAAQRAEVRQLEQQLSLTFADNVRCIFHGSTRTWNTGPTEDWVLYASQPIPALDALKGPYPAGFGDVQKGVPALDPDVMEGIVRGLPPGTIRDPQLGTSYNVIRDEPYEISPGVRGHAAQEYTITPARASDGYYVLVRLEHLW